jgi:hypothetical protein
MRTTLACAAIALAGVAVAAQYPKFLTESPGVWKPWKGLTAIASARKEQAATPALVKAFEAELLALNAILQRAPSVSPPTGFSVETWGSLDNYRQVEHAPGQPPPGRLPLMGAYTFGAFPIFEYERNGTVIREDTGETALQDFAINQITRPLGERGGPREWGQVDHDAFLRPLPRGEFAGLPRYGDALVIARDPAALWAPLTLRAALDIVVLARQAAVEAARERVDAVTRELAAARDPERRAQRQRDAEAGAVHFPDPKAFLAQMAEVWRKEEASLAADLEPSGGAATALAEATAALAEATSWISALSPAEQAAPSCFAEGAGTLRTRFRAAPAPGCHPLVRPNYAYFDPSLPRSAPQVVLITGFTRCFDTADPDNRGANAPGPHGCRANRALVETMDKDAIRAWLR